MLQHTPQAQLLQLVLCRDRKKREDRLGSMAKASKNRGADPCSQPTKTYALSIAQAMKCAFFADRWCFFYCTAAQCVIDSDKDDSKAPSHAVRNHLLASCGVQATRSSTCTAEHASGKTATARGSNIGLVNLPFTFCHSTHGSVRFALSVWSSTLCHTTGLLPAVGRCAGVHRTAHSINHAPA